MSTGFTSYKNGNITEPVKKVYLLFLKHQGFIIREDIELGPYDYSLHRSVCFGGHHADGAFIEGQMFILPAQGDLHISFREERSFQRIYVLGQCEPAEIVPTGTTYRGI